MLLEVFRGDGPHANGMRCRAREEGEGDVELFREPGLATAGGRRADGYFVDGADLKGGEDLGHEPRRERAGVELGADLNRLGNGNAVPLQNGTSGLADADQDGDNGAVPRDLAGDYWHLLTLREK